MDWGRTWAIKSMLARSWRQTKQWIWHDMKVGLLAALPVIFLTYLISGGDWKSVTVATVIVWPGLVLLVLFLYLFQNIFWPSRNETWYADFTPGYDDIWFSLNCKHGTSALLGIACRVRDPNARESRTEGGGRWNSSRYLLGYPRPDFDEHAPLAISGHYQVLWEEKVDGKWCEILRTTHDVHLRTKP